MLDTFLSGPYVPFTVSLALLFGLLALELVLALLGATLLGGDTDFEIDAVGAEGLDAVDVEIDFDAGELGINPAEFDIPSPEDPAISSNPTPGSQGLLGWLGLGKVPTLIWLASLLLAFGVSGVLIQNAVAFVVAPLPAALAALPAAAIGLWFARSFGAVFARLLPKTETQSVSKRHLSRRAGIVTQGTAKRGQPAEVRVADRYGNHHYLRAEPMRDTEEIPQGAEVVVLRHRPTGEFRLISLSS